MKIKSQSSHLDQSQMKENREETNSSAKQMTTDTDGDDCGGPEPTRNPDSKTHFQPNTDGKSSDSSETEDSEDEEDEEEELDEWQEPLSDSGPETEDSEDDWKETRAAQSGGKNNETRNRDSTRSSCDETLDVEGCKIKGKSGKKRVPKTGTTSADRGRHLGNVMRSSMWKSSAKRSSALKSQVKRSSVTKTTPEFLRHRAKEQMQSKVLRVRCPLQEKDKTVQQDISRPQKERLL